MADPLPPLFDSGNTLVTTNIPHTIVVGTIPTAGGKTGILTIRTPDCTLTITMDDPKLYTQPFNLGDVHFRWIPNQQLDDYTCIPSEVQLYLKEMGDPAGSDPSAAR